MKNIRIRDITSSDMGQIADLLRTRDDLDASGAEKRRQLFEWLAFRNPYAKGEATYLVAEDSGGIVAHLGRMPTEFNVRGQTVQGYFMQDLYVHPEYRDKGFGFFLTISLIKAVDRHADSLGVFIGGTSFTMNMLRHRKYYETQADSYVKLLDPRAYLQSWLRSDALANAVAPLARVALSAADGVLTRVTRCRGPAGRIERFDSRFDDLNERIAGKLGICTSRRASFLNWKYIDRPFSEDAVFAVEEHGSILGFIVVAPVPDADPPEGSMVDIVAEPDDIKTICSLCVAAIEYFRNRKAQVIRCRLTSPAFAKVLRKYLFLKGSGEPVFLANLDRCDVGKSYLTDMANWHVTNAESDGYMLMPP